MVGLAGAALGSRSYRGIAVIFDRTPRRFWSDLPSVNGYRWLKGTGSHLMNSFSLMTPRSASPHCSGIQVSPRGSQPESKWTRKAASKGRPPPSPQDKWAMRTEGWSTESSSLWPQQMPGSDTAVRALHKSGITTGQTLHSLDIFKKRRPPLTPGPTPHFHILLRDSYRLTRGKTADFLSVDWRRL